MSFPGPSRAASVLVLERDGKVIVRNDRFLPPLALTPTPLAAAARTPSRAHTAAVAGRVRTDLTRLRREGWISVGLYRSYMGSFNGALQTVNRLGGTRAAALGAVIANLESIAARGLLTPSRLDVLFLTLNRNRQWWTSGPLLGQYQRVQFAGSRLVWEYYPGQGIELQALGSFGTANALCTAGPRQESACTALLSELIPLAADRAGRLTWEYYFEFDGGIPPWTSAMSQATALAAFAHAYKATKNGYYLTVGRRALALFTAPPPLGVAVKTSRGARYVQYTFDPLRGDEVINAFLQSVIGLDEFALTSGSHLAARLFAAGNAEAKAELPQFDTGAWSLYQPGIEDDLNYHELVTGFLQRLCAMTKAHVYCTTAAHFERDLKTPPAIDLLTKHLVAHKRATVYFALSKVSRVGIVVLHAGKTLFLTSADFPHGTHAFDVPPLPAVGSYMIRLHATDLAGNSERISSMVRVSR